MKTKTEFEVFWNANLDAKLEKLRQAKLVINKRLSYKRHGYAVLAIIIILILLGPLFSKFKGEALFGPLIFISVLYSIFWPAVIFYRRNSATSPLEDEYVNTILPRIVSFINADLKFEFNKGLSLDEFNKSKFLKEANHSISKILISGQRMGNAMKIAGFIAQKKVSSKSNNQKSTTSTTTLFDGLYAIIELKKPFESSLTVRDRQFKTEPEGAEFLKSLGLYEEETAPIDYVKTGNEDFDKQFEVISSKEWEARNFLNPLMQTNLSHFKKNNEFCFTFKFSEKELFVFSPIPTFFNSALIFDFEKKENSELFFSYINFALGLIDIILPEESISARP